MTELLPVPCNKSENYDENDKNVTDCDKRVTDKSVTKLSTCVLEVLESNKEYEWSPKEVALELHANPSSIRKILDRLQSMGKGGGPVIRTGYGLYQYSADKNGQLSTLILHSGRVGIENLTYVILEARYPECQTEITEKIIEPGSKCDKLPSMKPGYPRHLPTGQEIRWEIWDKGSERISFVSHGNPYSIDLMIYLHEEMAIKDGFDGERWKRVSIEVNKDSQTMTLNPECITFKDTYGVLLKSYNHGQQMRNEVADRNPATVKDTLSLFLNYSDNGDGKAALREVRLLRKDLEAVSKDCRLAINIARKIRDWEPQSRSPGSTLKKQTPSAASPFRTGAEIKSEQVSRSTDIQTS
ncbi:hypothetical protein [Methanoregula sp.]|uniref:hypothetical protein n=1 Tax=Methanoregula sp. TaxID=2052170 RepID=UPI003C5A97F5